MSFIKITTKRPDGHVTSGITQQGNITAEEAFDRRVKRAQVARQSHTAYAKALTIRLHSTEIVDYSQFLEYAETIDGFAGDQPELPDEYLSLMEPTC